MGELVLRCLFLRKVCVGRISSCSNNHANIHNGIENDQSRFRTLIQPTTSWAEWGETLNPWIGQWKVENYEKSCSEGSIAHPHFSHTALQHAGIHRAHNHLQLIQWNFEWRRSFLKYKTAELNFARFVGLADWPDGWRDDGGWAQPF